MVERTSSTYVTDISCIEIYPKALDRDTCKSLISGFQDKIQSEGRGVKHNLEKTDYGNRDDYQINADQHGSFEPLLDSLKSGLNRCWNQYLDVYWPGTAEMKQAQIGFNKVLDPTIKLQKSAPEGGYCSWHCEQGSGNTSPRFAVWMIYLNTVSMDHGGRTEFYHQDIAISPTEGTAVIWPAGPSHFHRSSPDLKADKYIATGWFVYGLPDNYMEPAGRPDNWMKPWKGLE